MALPPNALVSLAVVALGQDLVIVLSEVSHLFLDHVFKALLAIHPVVLKAKHRLVTLFSFLLIQGQFKFLLRYLVT
jgi:hypothetical protein